MRKSKVASWVIAAVLVGGAGVALAETAPENPAVSEDPTTTTTAEVTTTTTTAAPKTEAPKTEAPETETDADEAEGAQGEHGALVSAAAHDHSHDEACGNHGAVVSAVAKTGELPECAGGPAADSAPAAPAKTKHGKGHAKKH